MKKVLPLMMLALGLCTNSSAATSQEQLYKQLMAQTNREEKTWTSMIRDTDEKQTLISTNKEYSFTAERPPTQEGPFGMTIKALETGVFEPTCGDKRVPTRKELQLNLTNDATQVRIRDRHMNGLSEGDFFAIDHKLKEGGEFQMVIKYIGKGKYLVWADVYDTNDQRTATFDLDTENANPIWRSLVSSRVSPIVEYGNNLYQDIANCVLNNKKIDAPWKDLQEALNKTEDTLSKTPKNQKAAINAAYALSKNYNDLVKKNSRKYAYKK